MKKKQTKNYHNFQISCFIQNIRDKKKKLEKIYKIIFAKQTIEIMDNKY